MNGLVFQNQLPVTASDPNRADIACFVGFVGRRKTAIPQNIRRFLEEQGWTAPPYGRSSPVVENLLDLPIPIESWEVFDQLFAWDQREYSPGLVGATYLGAGVRSFFAQGGRKCYVVRVGDPWLSTAQRSERLTRLAQLLPGYPNRLTVSAVDRNSWSGIGHLFGLPDVSFLCLPDLADAVGIDRQKLEIQAPDLPLSTEQFVECSEPEALPLPDSAVRFSKVPCCDAFGYEKWGQALRLIVELINTRTANSPPLREIQLVAALPIPETGTDAEQNLLKVLNNQKLASTFLQLVYPWAKTPGSVNLPQQLESPDALLTGILARNALMRGTFRSAANLHLADLQDIYPVLSFAQMWQPYPDSSDAKATSHNLLERVSLLGFTPSGLRLLSDVTSSLSESYRPASVNRLVATIIRAARRLGEEIAFDVSGEVLWTKIRENLANLLLILFQIGALRGNSQTEAFQVRCDRRTMTQDDIDNGRVIAQIEFQAAVPIERITIVLAMNEGGQVSLIPPPKMVQEAA